MSAHVVCFGEFLMRLNPPGMERIEQASGLQVTYAGAEASVGAALVAMGHAAEFVTALPDGVLGDAALARLRARGLGISHVRRMPGRIGIYFLENGCGVRSGDVTYDRAGSVFARTADYPWDRILRGASWLVLGGVTPALGASAQTALDAAMAAAKACGVKIAFDANFRRKLWSAEVAAEWFARIAGGVDLLVVGVFDLGELWSIPLDPSDSGSFQRAAFELQRRTGCRELVVTRRLTNERGMEVRSAWHFRDGAVTCSEGAPYLVTEPLGGGDAFLGGLLAGIIEGRSPSDALALANAAAALKYSIFGDFLVATRTEIENVVVGVRPGIRR